WLPIRRGLSRRWPDGASPSPWAPAGCWSSAGSRARDERAARPARRAVYLRAAGGHRLHHRAVRRGRLLRAQRWRRPDETVPVLPGGTARGAVPVLPAETGRRGRGRAQFAPRRRRVMIARLALVVGLVLGCAVPADAATTETYADYAMLGER